MKTRKYTAITINPNKFWKQQLQQSRNEKRTPQLQSIQTSFEHTNYKAELKTVRRNYNQPKQVLKSKSIIKQKWTHISTPQLQSIQTSYENTKQNNNKADMKKSTPQLQSSQPRFEHTNYNKAEMKKSESTP